MPKFTGKLKSNAIFAALYNMIISQQVFADNIKGTKMWKRNDLILNFIQHLIVIT